MSLIHKFIQDGEYYVIDVNSGALHVVDEIVYDLLDENSLKEKEELIEIFKGKHRKAPTPLGSTVKSPTDTSVPSFGGNCL